MSCEYASFENFSIRNETETTRELLEEIRAYLKRARNKYHAAFIYITILADDKECHFEIPKDKSRFEWDETDAIAQGIENLPEAKRVDITMYTNLDGEFFWKDWFSAHDGTSLRPYVVYKSLTYADTGDGTITSLYNADGYTEELPEVKPELVKKVGLWYDGNFVLEINDEDNGLSEETVEKINALAPRMLPFACVDTVDPADEDGFFYAPSVNVSSNELGLFLALLNDYQKIADESGATMTLSADFVPDDIHTHEDIADMSMMRIEMTDDGARAIFFHY